MRREKMNNKGFSLVELIIVIAIMAILSAALAPQLMKYIEKSRVSTDLTSCSTIESCVNAALGEEDVYKAVAEKGNGSGVILNITANDSTGAVTVNTLPGTGLERMKEELVGNSSGTVAGSLTKLKAPKQTGKTVYVVRIETKHNATDGTYSVGKVKVETAASAPTRW